MALRGLCAAQAQEQLKATQDTVKQLTDQLAQVKQEAKAKLEERDKMMLEQCRSSLYRLQPAALLSPAARSYTQGGRALDAMCSHPGVRAPPRPPRRRPSSTVRSSRGPRRRRSRS